MLFVICLMKRRQIAAGVLLCAATYYPSDSGSSRQLWCERAGPRPFSEIFGQHRKLVSTSSRCLDLSLHLFPAPVVILTLINARFSFPFFSPPVITCIYGYANSPVWILSSHWFDVTEIAHLLLMHMHLTSCSDVLLLSLKPWDSVCRDGWCRCKQLSLHGWSIFPCTDRRWVHVTVQKQHAGGLLEVTVSNVMDSNISLLLCASSPPHRTCRHPYAGWRCDWHCGGPITELQTTIYWYLLGQLGARRWWSHFGRAWASDSSGFTTWR